MDYETRLKMYADSLHQIVKAEIENDRHVNLTPESVRDFFDNLHDMVRDTIAMNCIEENVRKKVEAN
jgi:hypothetical protein